MIITHIRICPDGAAEITEQFETTSHTFSLTSEQRNPFVREMLKALYEIAKGETEDIIDRALTELEKESEKCEAAMATQKIWCG